ncbi:MAG: signal peptidase I [Planctomycetia bacterium]|jgi:signal peptidase I
MEATNQQAAEPRWVSLAALLGLFAGPVAQVYVGRLRRAILFWLGGILLSLLSCSAMVYLHVDWLILSLLFLCGLLYQVVIIVDACFLAKRNRFAPLKRYQRWWVYGVFLGVICISFVATALVCKVCIAEPFAIVGRSMAPAIQPGDRILVDKLWGSPSRLKRYDMVVYRSASDAPTFVGRVIGLPGETIEVKDEQVLIDGKPIDDPYAECIPKSVDDPLLHYPHSSLPPELAVLVNYGPTKIPEDCFFVMGDNRHLSKDSRMFGPVSFSNYIGTARLIYWSREYTCPFPHKPDYRVPGPMRWERVGTRLD